MARGSLITCFVLATWKEAKTPVRYTSFFFSSKKFKQKKFQLHTKYTYFLISLNVIKFLHFFCNVMVMNKSLNL